MILNLLYEKTTQKFVAEPCPGIIVNRTRSFSNGNVQIDFDVDPAQAKADAIKKEKETMEAERAEKAQQPTWAEPNKPLDPPETPYYGDTSPDTRAFTETDFAEKPEETEEAPVPQHRNQKKGK
jgi:hypothetical protein